MVYMVFKEGHLVRACPERQSDPGVSERPGQEAAEPAVVVPPAATVRPAAEGPGVVAAPEQTESEPQAQPAAQKPTGATITPEEPCVAEPVMALLSGFWQVLELPVLAEAGTEVQSCHLEAPVTTPVHEDGGDVEMEDEPTFKVPTKRKKKGDLLSEPTEIHKQTVCFYSKLYSSERSGAQIVEESFLKDLPKLSEQVARELDRELTLAELHKALQGMENERAPGIDGLSVEFYKAFWAVIGQDVLEVLRDSMNVGQLPLSCRGAVLTLLPKKGDLTHLKNWRPVSLLCTDIKLLSKALASRLTKVMEQITHQDQSYCVPDRACERQTEQVEAAGPKDVLQGANAGHQQPSRVVPWHKLACVDPPPNLLARIQALLVDFFWDGLHWIPQSVLHLPKEEGGQGLVQLASRTAAFRLQFPQRLLTGPKDLIWRPVAHGLLHKVGGLGLDRTLFLMDTKTLDVSGLPSFYRGLFKIWNC
ncbi:hypothetical protein QTP86_013309 [Hemibagrus guttatus]|nr:hypothetical protein QTP86_013309 [Hemibagrus guttatus]